MKLNLSNQKRCAMTVVEVLVVVGCLVILVAMLLPLLAANKARNERISCVSNLKQISLDFRIQEGDNNNEYPMAGLVTNGCFGGPRTAFLETNFQTKGFNDGQIAWIGAMGISNIVHEAKILQCPRDNDTPITTNSAGLKIRISYFLNLNASEGYPQELLSGDDNLAIGGVPVKPGILLLSSSIPFSWTTTRHGPVENISVCDGSVEQQSSLGLQNAAAYSMNGTPSSTNRIAIP